ncbi:MAG TPA: ABC transporter substrate-binding protein [Pilimelia sp.]|nr:ABC transporter substrate-binding protein [Pilimelia sp.]
MRNLRRQGVVALGLAGLLAGTAACGGGDGGSGDSEGGGDTLVFGTSADPVSLDPAYVSDGESLRAARQIYETLVTTEQGGTEIVPLLAESWEPSAEGKTWTFQLREGVKFHDGTDFNAEAVCFNFDRWYNFKGVQQSASVSYYWQTVFSGYANNEDPALGKSLYASCEATDANTAVINLTSASASFLSGLALASFSIASPKALQEFEADKVSGTGEEPRFEGTYGREQAVGTGPYKLESFEPNERLVMTAFEDYWGEQPDISTLIFRPIADGAARKQALLAGEIQGYDLVDPADLSELETDFQLLERPAFNVGYVGINSTKAPLDNVKVRQAIAHALNREALVTAKYPPGSEVATQFMPPELFGYSEDVAEYPYDPARAKALLAEAGTPNPTIEFWYPTNVSRPYMPEPEANFQAFQADLTAAGFKVVPKSAPWNPDYLDAVNTGKPGLYLLGWTGDFGDPDNFVGTFFRTDQPAWGAIPQEIQDKLEAARAEPEQAQRTELYQEINNDLMDYVPGVPYVHTSPRLVFAKNVEGYVPSPVSIESFADITVN